MYFRLFLLATLLVGCSSGGGGSSNPTAPPMDWGSFRHDFSNTGLARGSLRNNKGEVELLNADLGGVTNSTPVIGQNDRMYLGTETGLLAINAKNGDVRWRFDQCDLAPETDSCLAGSCLDVGRIESSPTITANDDIVFGTSPANGTNGAIYLVHDKNDTPTCVWAFQPDTEPNGYRIDSSPIAVIDNFDFALLSVFVGTSEGVLESLNGDGTERWRFPNVPQELPNLTSSAAITFGGTLIVQTPDGFVRALDFSGRPIWTFFVGVDSSREGLLPSPALGPSTYSLGAEQSLYALAPDGNLKWRRQTLAPIPGSPVLATEILKEQRCSDSNAACFSDADCPAQICGADRKCTQSGKSCNTDEDCPIETCGNVDVLDTIVQLVDEEGTLYGLRDANGEVLVLLRCSDTNSDKRCSDDGDCSNDETCVKKAALRPMWSEGSISVSNSPAISNDFFLVVASDEGLICARTPDGRVPDDDIWESGCVAIPGSVCEADGRCTQSGKFCETNDDCDEDTRVRTSPIIDRNGNIYVVTNVGLYVIK